jgi:Lrp/AsnC family leucine-responsive transcriptional regulator
MSAKTRPSPPIRTQVARSSAANRLPTKSTVFLTEREMKNGDSVPIGSDLRGLGATDLKIISELIEDGRVSLAELGRRVSLSSPAVAERVKRLEQSGVITGYHAEIDLRKFGYQLTAIVRVKPAPGQLPKIPELAEQLPEVTECHRITGDDCFFPKIQLRSIDELSEVLDRFLVFGETTTSIVNNTPIAHRMPPLASGL